MSKITLDLKTKVPLCGFAQKIHIRSCDEANPVLLFLHGGPGVINRHSVINDHADLLDMFTIVAWDQRGSGGSYWEAAPETLTVKQLTDDAAALVDWLCSRFSKDKIFVIGGSWGSVLGTHLAYRYPEKVAAFVGFGQVVDGTQNEALSYKFALESAQKAGDSKSVKLLEDLGHPENGMYKGGLKGLMTQRKVMMKYGGYSPSEAKRSTFDAFVKPVLLSGEYSPSDLIGLAKGYRYVLNAMWHEVGKMNLAAQCPNFKMPYFIFNGRLDNNTPASLVEDYFAKLEAPRKELIWFEQSGHNPMADEPKPFKTKLKQMLSEVMKDEHNKGARL